MISSQTLLFVIAVLGLIAINNEEKVARYEEAKRAEEINKSIA